MQAGGHGREIHPVVGRVPVGWTGACPVPRLEGGARRPKVPVSALPSDPRIRGPRLCRGRALRETVEVAEEEARDA